MTANRVQLMGTYGGDLTHALSAWTSTDRELTDEKRARIPVLLAQLAGHGTPFEKSAIHFLVTLDTASHIHAIKHRIGVSVNGESARYKEHVEDKFYIPEDWPEEQRIELRAFSEEAFDRYHRVVGELEAAGLGRKRAKESARFFLPYSSQVTLDIQFNFRSFVHFLSLRYDDHAQREIYWVAEQMLELLWISGGFDASLEAFGYGRPV